MERDTGPSQQNTAASGPRVQQAQVGPRNDFQAFAQNLKRTALGVRFGRILFTEPGSLSPQDITRIMKELGMDIPHGVQVTADCAQLYVTGSAAIDAYDAYDSTTATTEDIKAVVNPTVGSLRLAQRIAKETGLINGDSQFAQITDTATSVLLIIASGGLNVGAWLSLAMSFAFNEEKIKLRAKMLASQAASESYRALISPQAEAAAKVFQTYQESQKLPPGTDGKLSAFGFIGSMAEAAPDLWPQFFPEFGVWAPIIEREIVGRSEVRSWYGSKQKDSVRITWQSVAGLNRDQIREFVFAGLIEPVAYPFFLANREYEKLGKASLFDLALLSALTPLTRIPIGADLSFFLDRAMLSPSDFRDSVIQDFLEKFDETREGFETAAAVKVDGRVVARGARAMTVSTYRRQLLEADKRGRIDVLRRFDELNTVLRGHYSYPQIQNRTQAESWFSGPIISGRGAGPVVFDERAAAKWRNIRDFIGAMGMMQDIRRDPFFKNWGMDDGRFMTGRFENYDFISDIERFEREHARLSQLSYLRQVNTLAHYNVAGFLDTTPDKLIRVTPPSFQGPALYTKK